MLCESDSAPSNSAARHRELWSHRMYTATGLTCLSGVQTSKSPGLAFQLSNGDEVKKTGMVVRTT